MALEATHVRFARDLHYSLQPSDNAAYYSGSIYPDSRYTTKIQREKTHDMQGLFPDLFSRELSDFKKGWLVHLMYDNMARDKYLDLCPQLQMEMGQYNQAWVYATAAKIVEDGFSYDALGSDLELLKTLSIPSAPQGEDQAALEQYYDTTLSLYMEKPTLEKHYKFWLQIGADERVINGLRRDVEKITSNQKIVSQIKGIYERVLEEAVSFFTVRDK